MLGEFLGGCLIVMSGNRWWGRGAGGIGAIGPEAFLLDLAADDFLG